MSAFRKKRSSTSRLQRRSLKANTETPGDQDTRHQAHSVLERVTGVLLENYPDVCFPFRGYKTPSCEPPENQPQDTETVIRKSLTYLKVQNYCPY